MAFNIFGDAPQSLTGLLGEQATQDLQKKALTTGLINAAIGYIAQPKNQRYGSALPYIGKALLAGQEGAQGVYQGAIKDYELQQKIAEAKRKQEQQAALQGMISGIQDPNERLFAQLAPEQFVTSKLKPAESPFAKIDVKDYTPESVAAYKQTNDITQLRKLDTSKEAGLTEEPNRVAIAKFNKPFNKLNQQEAQEVNSYIESRQVNVARASVPSQQPGFKDAGELRKEYNALPQVKAFSEVQNAFDQIKTGISATSAAGDLTAATKFMKLLDPGSVVRESELGMAMAATGVLDRALAYKDFIAKGTKLSPSQRADFLNVANQLYNAAAARKREIDSQYSDIARVGGLDPNLVIGSPSTQGAVRNKIMQELQRRQQGQK